MVGEVIIFEANQQNLLWVTLKGTSFGGRGVIIDDQSSLHAPFQAQDVQVVSLVL